MTRYLVQRSLFMLLTLVLVVTVIFFLLRLIPGTAVDVYLTAEANLTEEQIAAVKARFGLDQPPLVQFTRWVGAALRGDLGESIRMRQPVSGLILSRLPVTAELAVLSLLFSTPMAIALGIISAVRRNTVIDFLARLVATLGLSIPRFWLAIVFMFLASRYLGWSPEPIFVPFWEDPVRNLQQTLPPSLIMAWLMMAVVMRLTRSCMLEILAEDYVRTARAKGLRERVVLYRHCLRNALIPIVTTVGIQAGLLFRGAVVVEVVFGLPGLGWLLLNGVYMRDYPVIQASVLFIAVMFVAINLLVDLAYSWIDPKIRYG